MNGRPAPRPRVQPPGGSLHGGSRVLPYQLPRPETPGLRPLRPPASPAAPPTLMQEILDEVKRCREEINRISVDMKRMGKLLDNLYENYKDMRKDMNQQADDNFSIERSTYKDNMIGEIGQLFIKSLKRQPTREEIGQAIMKVLGADGHNKLKFNKAKTFSFNRLTDLRCEERRRIFGNKPCDGFPRLTTEEFAGKFLSTIRARDEHRSLYIKHLALLRKFVRERSDSKNDTYKLFREWIDNRFASGFPTNEEWEEIMAEDSRYDYQSQSPAVSHEETYNGYFEVIEQQSGYQNYQLPEEVSDQQ